MGHQGYVTYTDISYRGLHMVISNLYDPEYAAVDKSPLMQMQGSTNLWLHGVPAPGQNVE